MLPLSGDPSMSPKLYLWQRMDVSYFRVHGVFRAVVLMVSPHPDSKQSPG